MRILVTTDGSEDSLQALPHATRLADAIGADVALAQILDKRQDLGSEFAPTLKEAAKAVSARWQDALRAIPAVAGGGVEAEVWPMRRREDMPTAIIRIAKECDADLVIMATRGAGKVRQALLGSVSMAVLGRSDIPLMLTGARITPPANSGIYRIVVTTDGSQASAAVWPAIRTVFRRVAAVNLDIMLVQVYGRKNPEQEEMLAAVDAEWQLSEFGRKAPSHLRVSAVARQIRQGERVEDAILDAASEVGADSIWMATQGRTLAKHVLLGGTALGVLNKSTVPVTLVRPRK